MSFGSSVYVSAIVTMINVCVLVFAHKGWFALEKAVCVCVCAVSACDSGVVEEWL